MKEVQHRRARSRKELFGVYDKEETLRRYEMLREWRLENE